MAKNGLRQFPRTFKGLPKAFREAYEEAYPGFSAMEKSELDKVILDFDMEEDDPEWDHHLTRNERHGEKGKHAAARDARAVKRYGGMTQEDLEAFLKGFGMSHPFEREIARWVYDSRFRKQERSTTTRRSNGYH